MTTSQLQEIFKSAGFVAESNETQTAVRITLTNRMVDKLEIEHVLSTECDRQGRYSDTMTSAELLGVKVVAGFTGMWLTIA